MRKKKDKLDELAQLSAELQRVRYQSLEASRRGDFRTVARMTCEAARLNRLILAAEGAEIPALEHLGDALFTGDAQESKRREPALV
jgi:hypothetical protein